MTAIVFEWPESRTGSIANLLQEGKGSQTAAQAARRELLVRYHEVVWRYFRARVSDPNKADEMYSNFAYALIRDNRKLRRHDPKRGRFRHYLKAVLCRMIADYYREQGKHPEGPLVIDPTAPNPPPSDDFEALWKQELLNKAWKALESAVRGGWLYQVLRFQADNPELNAPQIAERLGARLGKKLTPYNVRQSLHRARRKFALRLLEEVKRALEDPTPETLERELIDLELFRYCAKALKKASDQE
jgi:RNA polymerase sigma factor (sigma-70 family)